MAKIRKIASIENGIMQVLKILNEEEIQEAIGKSSSYLRKCSDPSQQQQLDHNDSVKLDVACVKKGKAPHLCAKASVIRCVLLADGRSRYRISIEGDVTCVRLKTYGGFRVA